MEGATQEKSISELLGHDPALVLSLPNHGTNASADSAASVDRVVPIQKWKKVPVPLVSSAPRSIMIDSGAYELVDKSIYLNAGSHLKYVK